VNTLTTAMLVSFAAGVALAVVAVILGVPWYVAWPIATVIGVLSGRRAKKNTHN